MNQTLFQRIIIALFQHAFHGFQTIPNCFQVRCHIPLCVEIDRYELRKSKCRPKIRIPLEIEYKATKYFKSSASRIVWYFLVAMLKERGRGGERKR